MLQTYRLEADLRRYAGITPYEDRDSLQRNLKIRFRIPEKGEITLSDYIGEAIAEVNSVPYQPSRLSMLEELFHISIGIHENMYQMRLFPDVKQFFTDLAGQSAAGICDYVVNTLAAPENHGTSHLDKTKSLWDLVYGYRSVAQLILEGFERYDGKGLDEIASEVPRKFRKISSYLFSNPIYYSVGHDILDAAIQESRFFFDAAHQRGDKRACDLALQQLETFYGMKISAASVTPAYAAGDMDEIVAWHMKTGLMPAIDIAYTCQTDEPSRLIADRDALLQSLRAS
jgi:hypothetical protein